MGCGAGHRHSLDLALVCLWYWPAAVTLIRPLAWELTFAGWCGPKNKNKTKQTKKNQDQVFGAQLIWLPCGLWFGGPILLFSWVPPRARVLGEP